jgi:PKD repeat protein
VALAIGACALVAAPIALAAEPDANFRWTSPSMQAGASSPTTHETVTFTSTSETEDATIRAQDTDWDLDGDGSTECNKPGVPPDAEGFTATKTFTTPGSYTIRLCVRDTDGETDVRSRTVTVRNRLPTASFNVTPQEPNSAGEPNAGGTVTFTSTSTDLDGSITKTEWDLDDDDSFSDDPQGTTVSRKFDNPGTFTVNMRVTDDRGGQATTSRTVVVNRFPTATFTVSPTQPNEGDTVSFDGRGSSDTDGSIAKTEWDLDNDQNFTEPGEPQGAQVSRAFPNPGAFTVRMRVTDNKGATAVTTRSFVVNAKPSAVFNIFPPDPNAGDTVEFDARPSTDPDGSIASVGWDLNNNGVFGDASGERISRRFDDPGTYTVGVQVTDNRGATSSTTRTFVVNGPPTASFTVDSATPFVGDPVTFTSTSTDGEAGDLTHEWDFNGDGVPDASGATVTHTFATEGSRTVGLRVTDRGGLSNEAFESVTVAARPFDPGDPGTPGDPGSVLGPAAPGYLTPFPIVRIRGRTTSTGARISLLTVDAPAGSTAELRCRGRSCARRRELRGTGPTASTSALIRFRSIRNRRLRAGTVLEVRVTKAGLIGKYTRFRIRRAKPPTRVDRCLMPGSLAPVACPPA